MFLPLPLAPRLTGRKSSLPLACIATFLVIGIEDTSPHPSAPAWVRHCPNRKGNGEDAASLAAASESIFRVAERASESDGILRRFHVGIHMGPYYCSDWVHEMVLLVRSHRTLRPVRRVNSALGIITGDGYASAGSDGGYACGWPWPFSTLTTRGRLKKSWAHVNARNAGIGEL